MSFYEVPRGVGFVEEGHNVLVQEEWKLS